MSQLISAWIDRKIEKELAEGKPAFHGYVKELLPMLMGMETLNCQVASPDLKEALYVYAGGYSTWMVVAFESFPERGNQNYDILQNMHWERHGVWHGGHMREFGCALTRDPKKVKVVCLPEGSAVSMVLDTCFFLEIESDAPIDLSGATTSVVRVPLYQVVDLSEANDDNAHLHHEIALSRIHTFMKAMI